MKIDIDQWLTNEDTEAPFPEPRFMEVTTGMSFYAPVGAKYEYDYKGNATTIRLPDGRSVKFWLCAELMSAEGEPVMDISHAIDVELFEHTGLFFGDYTDTNIIDEGLAQGSIVAEMTEGAKRK